MLNRFLVLALVASLSAPNLSLALTNPPDDPPTADEPSQPQDPTPPADPTPPDEPTEPEEPTPIDFATELASFISFADDVSALRSWFEALSAGEQETHAAAFNGQVDKLNAQETVLAEAITSQIDENKGDSNMYLLFETIKGMNPIKARKVFSNLVDRVSAKVNLDYVSTPRDPSKGQRARDAQAIRSYIGRAG